MRIGTKLICLVASISFVVVAYLIGAPWWAFLPAIVLLVLSLVSLGALNSEGDRSGMGPWGDSS